ncbi:DUF1992 domain-containing protein [Caldimonas thermodepolymerans]|jgi:hypothetical protein|uniref:DUF1992 domain-containing protein n=2 Tax=Caldimonas thermodepolymerans TaxID=215580 RepID=A0A2S5T728_9BURK|nr:DnaJ family domain-containing protein [Caldimonas thermodepolymerans]PPE70766.1 DUF1992 domain-containing protein [Caldimonas thermodepolymerans]QPC32981.1 DUF1992 domain-containing protein [Caldimonas thermodepolymerans]RDI03764.1 uncharacterized protein DUF1992 [Caldimonas thermodepolymerans]TCP09731.1 uncharacterized protein DUF1992 [Caldimonas thermodepolymerans]UZG45849.1 DUF1992 domain-containing protein [Caldimonas thermodepolymerans]
MVMSALEWVAEERIARAVAAGELSGLPGEGRPLELDDDRLVPVEQRAALRVLKNSGHVPEEVRLLKALREAEREAADAEGEARLAAQRRLLSLRVRLEAAGVPCGSGTAWAEYEPRIRARLGRQSG